MIALPTTFELNFVQVWQSSQTFSFFVAISEVEYQELYWWAQMQ
jgi:hypothetical protein